MTFYEGVATTVYRKYSGNNNKHIMVTNDGVNEIHISESGNSLDSKIKAGETLELKDEYLSEIHVKTLGGTSAFRLWFFGISEKKAEDTKTKQVALHKDFVEQDTF